MSAGKPTPARTISLAYLGLLAARRSRLAEAAAHYRTALRIKPDYPEAHNNLGTALARQGDLKQAAAHFARAVELRPDFAAARENLRRATAAR